MNNSKKLIYEIAVLYYEKKYTQQEIAEFMNLSRQTVSKFLSEAINENIVEIKVNNPDNCCQKLEEAIYEKFNVRSVVCTAVSKNHTVRHAMTVKSAAKHLMSIFEKGNLNIAVSWGRTIQAFINELEYTNTTGNLVFPLFGATDTQDVCFRSNELARGLGAKIGANVKYTWFPYLPDSIQDSELFKKTSYYKSTEKLWSSIDVAIIGIGNTDVLNLFESQFGSGKDKNLAVGDIATHFFRENGEFLNLYEYKLCASTDNLKNAGNTIAIVCGDDKTEAIKSALKTDIIDLLITDEHTAAALLS